MDRFELVMQQRAADQERQLRILVVKVALPLTQGIGKLIDRRGNETRSGRAVVGRGDPVLAPAELPGGSFLTSDTLHENLVHLLYQPKREREAPLESGKPVIECRDVVADLTDVIARCFTAEGGLQHLGHGRLSALDARTRHSLTGDVGVDQQMGIGQQPTSPRQATQGGIRLR